MKGSSSNGRVRVRTSLPKKPDQQKCISAPRALALFMGVLVIVTLMVDTYFLTSTDFRLKKLPRRFGGLMNFGKGGFGKTKREKGVHASVKKPWLRRHFKFQEEKNSLPKLEKTNREGVAASSDQTITAGKEPILKVFEQAGIPPLNDTMIQQLPTWEEIVNLIGPHPIVGGLDTCEAYKQSVPAVERMLGSSGMFNTGTNLVTHLLKRNCRVPERVEKYGEGASKEAYGMRWQVGFDLCSGRIATTIIQPSISPSRNQVPWGKHSPAKYKQEHATKQAQAINKEWIMPVVTMRHPYSWMHSMCKNVSDMYPSRPRWCMYYSI